jgi:hypothetical protein
LWKTKFTRLFVAALLLTICGVIAGLEFGIRGGVPAALLLLIIWALVAFQARATMKALARFKWVTKQGVVLGTYDCDPDLSEVEAVIDATLARFPEIAVKAAKSISGVKVLFAPGAFQHHGKPLKGFPIDGVILASTAEKLWQPLLAHELGHLMIREGVDPPVDVADKILKSHGV